MSGNHLHLKLKQTQQLSQNLQYSLRILQMSGLEIDREVEDWLADNPLLERGATPESPLEAGQLSAAIAQTHRHVGGDDAENAWENLAEEEDLHAYLHAQVCEHPLNAVEAAHVHVLIDFLDEHGYLTDSIEDIIDHTPLEWQLTEEDIEIAIENLQNFDPAGVATANLSQSLLHQLSRLPASQERRCAAQIANQYLDELKGNHKQSCQYLSKKLPEFDSEIIQGALELLADLNPYPSYGFSTSQPTSYIQPEVVIRKNEQDEWSIISNESVWPQIQLNPEIIEALNQAEQVDSVWREKVSDAKQKIEMLNQRKSTVLRIAEYILEKQIDFFDFGEMGLVPMLIKECAQHLDLAESTISRAVNQKYLACPRGIFPLRYFFSQTAVVGKDDEGISQNVIKAVMVELIKHENKQNPYNDTEITELLKQQGINISRRTVAKYRDLLNIPAANIRQE